MAAFYPYTIVHLQLTELGQELPLPSGNGYLVIWSDQLPLGHVWLDGKEEESEKKDIRKEIEWAISPALNYYLSQTTERGNWEQLLATGQYSLLSRLLEPVNKNLNIVTQRQQQKISIIICTCNRPAAIEQCLHSLEKCMEESTEVIVVDNAPDNTLTEEVVARFPRMRYVREMRRGLDIARNTGARYATGDIIAYTDDDVLIPDVWISRLRACFDDPLTMAVTGLVIPAELKTKAQVIFERDWGFNKGYLPRKFDRRYFLDKLESGVPAWDIGAGANMAFRRQAFVLAGFFDERLDVGASGCSGDSEMWYRILAEGWNCHYFPYLYVYHQHRRSLPELQSQLFYYMRGHVSSLLVQYENYRHKGNLRRLYRSLPRHYYYRLKNLLTGKGNRDNSTLFKEIIGCLAGWRYYLLHKHPVRRDVYCLSPQLTGEVTISTETRVSVVIPCYNQGNFLAQAIESVLNQTYSNVELIVVDDGSTDQTAAVCQFYQDRVRYIWVERAGVSAARNIGQQLSTGDFTVFLDADDYLYPDAMTINLSYFGYYKNAAFVSGGHIRIDEKGSYLSTVGGKERVEDNYWSLLQGNYIGMEGCIMYRREVFSYFHFDTSLAMCEDYDLNLRIARVLPVVSHGKPIAAYRKHSNAQSRHTHLMLKSALTVLKRQEAGLIYEKERQAWLQGMKNWKKYYRS